MLSITSTEKIVWKVQEPVNFPCFICGEERAVNKTYIKSREADAILMVCDKCNNQPTISDFWIRSFNE